MSNVVLHPECTMLTAYRVLHVDSQDEIDSMVLKVDRLAAQRYQCYRPRRRYQQQSLSIWKTAKATSNVNVAGVINSLRLAEPTPSAPDTNLAGIINALSLAENVSTPTVGGIRWDN